MISGTVSGCANGVISGSGHKFISATLQSNTQDFYAVPDATAWNTLFGSAVEFANYNTNERQAFHYVESLDHDRVAGAFKAWCRGGIVTAVATPLPPGRTHSYQHACESASYPVFMQRTVTVEPGGWLNVRAWLKKTVGVAYLPRVWIFDPFADPLLTGGAPLVEIMMSDSIDTWEVLALSYQNTGSVPRILIVRVLAKNGSGVAYSDFDIAIVSPLLITSGGIESWMPALAAQLSEIPGLQYVFFPDPSDADAGLPGTLQVFPCLVLLPQRGRENNYSAGGPNITVHRVQATLYVAAQVLPEAYAVAIPFIALVRNKLMGKMKLGLSTVHHARTAPPPENWYEGPGGVRYGDKEHLGIIFTLEVKETETFTVAA